MKKSAPGFTLIEILIAIVILSVVVTTIYAAFNGTFKIVKDSESNGGIYSMARTAMERMAHDVEAIAPYDDKLEFISRRSDSGGQDSMDISFRANAHLNFDEKNTTGGITTIQYYLKEAENENEGYVLMRDDVLVLLGKAGDATRKTGFAVCKGVQSVEYKFYDAGGKEYEAWDSVAGVDGQREKAPAVVAIVLKLINPDVKDEPYSFTTKVYIPLSQRAAL